MSQLYETLESISGANLKTFKVNKPKLRKTSKKLKNLIDYLIYCEGIEIIQVNPPKDIHKEALKIKAIYPLLEVEVINNRLKISI